MFAWIDVDFTKRTIIVTGKSGDSSGIFRQNRKKVDAQVSCWSEDGLSVREPALGAAWMCIVERQRLGWLLARLLKWRRAPTAIEVSRSSKGYGPLRGLAAIQKACAKTRCRASPEEPSSDYPLSRPAAEPTGIYFANSDLTQTEFPNILEPKEWWLAPFCRACGPSLRF